jgi:hypothetical protein
VSSEKEIDLLKQRESIAAKECEALERQLREDTQSAEENQKAVKKMREEHQHQQDLQRELMTTAQSGIESLRKQLAAQQQQLEVQQGQQQEQLDGAQKRHSEFDREKQDLVAQLDRLEAMMKEKDEASKAKAVATEAKLKAAEAEVLNVTNSLTRQLTLEMSRKMEVQNATSRAALVVVAATAFAQIVAEKVSRSVDALVAAHAIAQQVAEAKARFDAESAKRHERVTCERDEALRDLNQNQSELSETEGELKKARRESESSKERLAEIRDMHRLQEEQQQDQAKALQKRAEKVEREWQQKWKHREQHWQELQKRQLSQHKHIEQSMKQTVAAAVKDKKAEMQQSFEHELKVAQLEAIKWGKQARESKAANDRLKQAEVLRTQDFESAWGTLKSFVQQRDEEAKLALEAARQANEREKDATTKEETSRIAVREAERAVWYIH